MKISLLYQSWAEYQYWQITDKATVRKINQLIKEIEPSPFEVTGKSEP
jgi:toxin YoeB